MDISWNRACIKQAKTTFLMSIVTQRTVITERKFLSLNTPGPLVRPLKKLLLILTLLSAMPVHAVCVVGNCNNGTGTFTYADGKQYVGEFKDNKYNGQGTFYFVSGDRHVGEYKDGKRNGQGTYYFASGNRYAGEFKDDKYNGQGTYYFANGARYEGKYKDGKRNGQGTFYLADGRRYVGEFKDNKYNGQGTFYFVSGDRHVGEYKDGKRNGQGTYYLADGRRYAGEFKDDKYNGLGIFYDKTGIVSKEGLWEKNKLILAKKVDKSINSKGPEGFNFVPLPVQSGIQYGQYHALIIGVNTYSHSSIINLSEPVNDADKIKQMLQSKYTFEPDNVQLLANPTRKQILDALDRLSNTLSAQDNLLVFYSGHGHWDEQTNQGYWLPSDAQKLKRAKWISNGTIGDYINGIKTKHTLVISDACFSGGIFKTKKAFSDSSAAINTLYSLTSRKAITAGTKNDKVPDKSVFLKYLIKRLLNNSDAYLSSQSLFSRFNEAVINNSPTHQVPQFGVIRETGDEGGDFIFVKR